MKSVRLVMVVFALMAVGSPAYAYTDPGAIGLLGQMGYVIVFALMSGVLFLTKPIKKLFGRSDEAKKDNGETK